MDYTYFSPETVNGEAGPLGTAPRAVHASSFKSERENKFVNEKNNTVNIRRVI